MGNKASKGTAPAEQPTPTMGPKEPKPETDSTPTQSVVPRSIEIDQTVPSIPPSKAEEEKEETNEDGASEEDSKPKTVLPVLPLDKIDRTPPEPKEKEEDDPNLMPPPVFLMDAMSSLKGTEQFFKREESVSKEDDPDANDQLLLASPITHGEVCLDEPTPAKTEEPRHDSDNISIDEEVSAADEEPRYAPRIESTSDELVFSAFSERSSTRQIPEDVISMTSSVARGEDELLKTIMGASVAMPAMTSNESMLGSVAVSDFVIDETHWYDFTRKETQEQLLTLDLSVDADGNVQVVLQCGAQSSELPLEEKPRAPDSVPGLGVLSLKSSGQRILEKGESTLSENLEGPQETSVSQVSESKPMPTPLLDPEDRDYVSDFLMSPSVGTLAVTMDYLEAYGAVKLHINTEDNQSSKLYKNTSEVSSKQCSVDLNSPFVGTLSVESSQDVSEFVQDDLGSSTKQDPPNEPTTNSSQIQDETLATEVTETMYEASV